VSISRLSLGLGGLGLFALLCCSQLAAAQRRNADREAAIATQNLAPRAQSEEEAAAVNALQAEADPRAQLATADNFLKTYPASQLVGLIHRIRMQAHLKLGNPRDAIAAGEAGLAFDLQYLESVMKRAEASAATSARRDRNAPPPIDKNAPAFHAFVAEGEQLRLYYYQQLMRAAQGADDFSKAVDYGEKALAVNPDDLFTLITLAQTIAERPSTNDKENGQAMERAEDLALRASRHLKDLMAGPSGPSMPADQRNELLGAVYATLGRIYLNQRRYGDSEKAFLAAIEARKDDPVLYLRLGLAYAQQNKRSDALDALAKSVYLKGVTEAQARQYLEAVYQQERKSLDGLDLYIQAAGARIGR